MSTRPVILGLLRERPLHGYEIKPIIEEHMGDWTNIAFGSIYFALKKLSEEGFVEQVAVEHEGRHGTQPESEAIAEMADARRCEEHTSGNRFRQQEYRRLARKAVALGVPPRGRVLKLDPVILHTGGIAGPIGALTATGLAHCRGFHGPDRRHGKRHTIDSFSMAIWQER